MIKTIFLACAALACGVIAGFYVGKSGGDARALEANVDHIACQIAVGQSFNCGYLQRELDSAGALDLVKPRPKPECASYAARSGRRKDWVQ